MKLNQIFISFLLACIAASCVQKTHLKTVNIKVIVAADENAESIGIRGEFTNPPWKETVALNDEDEDGVYEGSFSMSTGQYGVEFKFVKDGDVYELENHKNRLIKFEYKPETISYSCTFDKEEAKIERK